MGVASSGGKGSSVPVQSNTFAQQAAAPGLGQSLLPTPTGVAAGAGPVANDFGPANVPMEVSPALQSVSRASGMQAPAPAPTPAPAPMQRRGGTGLQDFFNRDAGFGGGIDPATGKYVAPSQLAWDQHNLRMAMGQMNPAYMSPESAARMRRDIMMRNGLMGQPPATPSMQPSAPVQPPAPAQAAAQAAVPGGKISGISPLLQNLLGQMQTGAAQSAFQPRNYLNPAPAPQSVPQPAAMTWMPPRTAPPGTTPTSRVPNVTYAPPAPAPVVAPAPAPAPLTGATPGGKTNANLAAWMTDPANQGGYAPAGSG